MAFQKNKQAARLSGTSYYCVIKYLPQISKSKRFMTQLKTFLFVSLISNEPFTKIT